MEEGTDTENMNTDIMKNEDMGIVVRKTETMDTET
jgi:hypothetical protein